MNLAKLREPFAANEIEWRIGQAGVNTRGTYAKVLAYITNRAIMERLDDVCGPENWRNEFRYEQNGAVLCGISVKLSGEWVTKWDGAENTDIEAVKGGLSNAMKRAAVQWGIGRYLYDLEEGWATIGENGANYCPAKADQGGKKGYPAFRWDPPKLPSWALPGFTETKPEAKAAPAKLPNPTRSVVENATKAAEETAVRGKMLRDHTTPELQTMKSALRTEGQTKHKALLGAIELVLRARPDKDSDDNRAAAMIGAAEADDDLGF